MKSTDGFNMYCKGSYKQNHHNMQQTKQHDGKDSHLQCEILTVLHCNHQPQQLRGLSRRFQKANLVICRRLELHYTITGIKSPCYIVESVAQRSQRRACNPEVGSSSLPRLTSFDLKKSKGQIDQWRVMDFLDLLMDFLNAYLVAFPSLILGVSNEQRGEAGSPHNIGNLGEGNKLK